MAHSHVIGGESPSQAQPQIRTIGLADLKDALARGLDDFLAMPSHAVFLCLIYPVVGFVLARIVLGANVLPLLFPLAAGFALIGPLAALGLYEMSRRREQGLDVSWKHALDIRRSPSLGAIMVLGLLLVAIVVPILGHATWHLYRKVIEPDLSDRPRFYEPKPREQRHAADFPAALFPTRRKQ